MGRSGGASHLNFTPVTASAVIEECAESAHPGDRFGV